MNGKHKHIILFLLLSGIVVIIFLTAEIKDMLFVTDFIGNPFTQGIYTDKHNGMHQKNDKALKDRSAANKLLYLAMLPADQNPDIRVLLYNEVNNGYYAQEITVSATGEYTLDVISSVSNDFNEISDGLTYPVNNKENQTDSMTVSVNENTADKIYILKPVSTDTGFYIDQVKKYSQEEPYFGLIELHITSRGIYVINVLQLEEYLYYVVPSEMPASYPLEALKAQAVCARTYAYHNIMDNSLREFEADVDDTTSFQVYHKTKATKQTELAVKSTEGTIITNADKTLYDVFYYSTSWGEGTTTDIWNTEDAGKNFQYISSDYSENDYMQKMKKGNEEDYEYNENYYRWKYTFSRNSILNTDEIIDYFINNKPNAIYEEKNISGTKNDNEIGIKVLERGSGGAVYRLEIDLQDNRYLVIGENSIRKILGSYKGTLELNNGIIKKDISILPSSFFAIEYSDDNIILYGGGFGHGIGMSQNGAKAMALAGYDYGDIIKKYFPASCIKSIYSGLK